MPSYSEQQASLRLITLIRDQIHKDHGDVFKAHLKSARIVAHLAAPFNPRYLDYHTTDYPKIQWAVGSEAAVEAGEWWATEVRAHEAVHMWDRKRLGWLFNLLYASPHVFALPLLALFGLFGGWGAWAGLGGLFLGLGVAYARPRSPRWFWACTLLGGASCAVLGAFTAKWHLLWLAGAGLCLSPVLNWLGASYGRAWLEYRGYTMTLAMVYWKLGYLPTDVVTRLKPHFTGPDYYFMHPWKGGASRRFDRQAIKVTSGAILQDPFFKKVHGVLIQAGILRTPTARDT